jgi:murein DD-endopeptidase MepM/ murein hydrolase activator NlpD
MNRTVLIFIALLLVATGAAVFFLDLIPASGPTYTVNTTLYDTDASGTADLRLQDIVATARLWYWDRDDDGAPEVVAYDALIGPEGQLQPSGGITAWDYGGDSILDEGEVPVALQELLRSEPYAAALAAGEPGNVELVDMRVREFVGELARRYDAWRLSEFELPVLGSKLPDADRLLPGASRTYRFGVHQGFDMYGGYVGVPTGHGAPVVAAKAGSVVRADLNYVEMTPDKYADVIATSRAAGTTPPAELDLLRGRQIWIDHGHGIVTRYAHLSGIAPGIEPGAAIGARTVIGFVGNSGMDAAANGTRGGAHLHFEMRIDDRYLGEGMLADAIRLQASRIFGLAE